jgi:hypothetical protein
MIGRGLRHAPIALDHLVAEVAAFPLVSEASFATSVQQLTPAISGKTATLWQCAESQLLQQFPGTSVDEMRLHRDAEWFPKGTASTADEILLAIARRYLAPQGNVAVPSLVEPNGTGSELDPTEARSRYRWIVRSIPSDLLLTALWSDRDEPREAFLGQPQLSQRLNDDGFAELHLHLGAGTDFSSYWAATMGGIRDASLQANSFASPGAPFQNGTGLGRWLVISAICRQFLSGFLLQRKNNAFADFQDYVVTIGFPRFRILHGVLACDVLRKALAALRIGAFSNRFPVGFSQAMTVFRMMVGAFPRPNPQSTFLSDPLARLFPPDPQFDTPPETRFIAESLKYLRSSQTRDPLFEIFFWQGQRVRNLYFRSVALHPRTPGLTAFTRVYSRLSPGQRVVRESAMARRAAVTSGLSCGLRFLELRTSPYACAAQMAAAIFAMEQSLTVLRTSPDLNAKNHRLQWGLIVHFLRLRSAGVALSNPLPGDANGHANPAYSLNLSGYRFSGCFRFYQAQAQAIQRLMQQRPSILMRLRALDVCTDEMAVPLWVLAPLLRRLRRESERQVLRYRQQLGNRETIKPLRMTVHVGEDYPHLLTGLRNIGLALDFLKLSEGDRLGHALALGIDSERWHLTTGRVRMTVEERLFDLAWVWDSVARGGAANVQGSKLVAVQKELAELSRRWYGKSLDVSELGELQKDLHSSKKLASSGFPQGTAATVDSLLHDYLTSTSVFRAGRELIWVNTDSDGEICTALQRWLRMRVSRLGLALEINPSSNLLIGNLGDLQHHPFWRLADSSNDPIDFAVPLVVGSDDPITFATSLPDEYSLLYDTMLQSQVSASDALNWLENIRRTGNDFRFTLAGKWKYSRLVGR